MPMRLKEIFNRLLNNIKPFFKRIFRKEKIPFIALWVVCLAVLIACVAILLQRCVPKSQKDIKQYRDDSISEYRDTTVPTDDDGAVVNPVDFDALYERNMDVCGWIYIPETNIDYPVMQSRSDETRDFYLDHDIDGKESFDGSIYIDKLCNADFYDKNTVIYGHNLFNQQMFTQLHKFRNADFFKQNEYITIFTPERILTYRIYAAFIYDDRRIAKGFRF